MTPENILLGLVNIILFFYLWFFLFREYFVDSQRHYLFALREQLFNYVVENNLTFDIPAVKNRWEEINASIRFTHESHLILLASLFSFKKLEGQVKEIRLKRNETEKELDEGIKDFLQKNREEEFKLYISYILKSSLIILLFAFVIALIVAISEIIARIFRKMGMLRYVKLHARESFDEFHEIALASK